MTDGDFQDWPRRPASNKVSCNEAFEIPISPQYDGCERGLASMDDKYLDKKGRKVE